MYLSVESFNYEKYLYLIFSGFLVTKTLLYIEIKERRDGVEQGVKFGRKLRNSTVSSAAKSAPANIIKFKPHLSKITGTVCFLASYTYDELYVKYHAFVPSNLASLSIVLTAAALFIFASALLSAIAAFKKNNTILPLITLLLAISITAELSSGFSGYAFNRFTVNSVANRMYDSLTKEENSKILREWDIVQNQFSCCAIESYQEWLYEVGKLPASCCKKAPDKKQTKKPHPPHKDECRPESHTLHKDGCLDPFARYVTSQINVISRMAVLTALLQISGICCLLCIYYAFKHADEKKRAKEVLVTERKMTIFSI